MIACIAAAQTISRQYKGLSLSKVLEDLNAVTENHNISFIYNDLENFTVTCNFKHLSLEEALHTVVGFYPVRIAKDNDKFFLECTYKTERHLTGTIIDEHGQPLPFANVAILNPADSTLLSGGVSNEAGQFVVPYEQEKILARITFVGYKTTYRICTQENVGTIQLQPDNYTINGVVVKGEIPQYKMTTGGMTIDIQHSLLRDIGTADDLLSMMPMIQGKDGKFEVFAKGEPEIYINNKKVRNASELKQLKSVDVKSVDIITAPGAQYNAEVNAVIRIKTLKAQGEGLSLMATSDTWKNNKWNNYNDLTLKYRIGGLEAFANIALDNGHYSNDQDIHQELHIKKDKFDVDAGLPIRSRWTQLQYQAGLSYDFNTDHSVGLSFSSQHILNNKYHSDMTQDYLKNGAFYGDVFLKTDINELDKPVWELNTYYVGKVGKLNIDLNATILQRKTENHLNQQEFSKELGDRTITKHEELWSQCQSRRHHTRDRQRDERTEHCRFC